MKYLARCTVLMSLGLTACFVAGCGNKPAAGPGPNAPAEAKAAAAADTTPQLTGADEVRAALEKKDYDAAMAALLRVKQVATTDEQQVQFTSLKWEMKTTLMGAAETDPKAAEALMTLRAMTLGR